MAQDNAIFVIYEAISLVFHVIESYQSAYDALSILLYRIPIIDALTEDGARRRHLPHF